MGMDELDTDEPEPPALVRLREHAAHLDTILERVQAAGSADELRSLSRSLATSMRLTPDLIAQAVAALDSDET